MSLMEQKKRIEERQTSLEKRFEQAYERLQIKGLKCFRKAEGGFFTLCKFPGEFALVVEYADSYEEAELCAFEDGDRFYVDDMDEETMFQAMLREIEQ